MGEVHTPEENSIHSEIAGHVLQGFADYMNSTQFQKGMSHLINLAQKGVMVIMGATIEPEHCHRNMIADYLTLQEIEAIHLLDIEKDKVKARSICSAH